MEGMNTNRKRLNLSKTSDKQQSEWDAVYRER